MNTPCVPPSPFHDERASKLRAPGLRDGESWWSKESEYEADTDDVTEVKRSGTARPGDGSGGARHVGGCEGCTERCGEYGRPLEAGDKDYISGGNQTQANDGSRPAGVALGCHRLAAVRTRSWGPWVRSEADGTAVFLASVLRLD